MAKKEEQESISDTHRVNRHIISKLIGVTPQRVSHLHKEGILQQTDRARYDMYDCVRAYVKYCNHGKVASAAAESKNRWNEAKAAEAELKLAKELGKAILVEDAQEIFNGMMITVVSHLEGLGSKLSSELAGITDPKQIQQRIKEEVRRIREASASELARLAPDQSAGGDTEATATENARSVG